MQIPADYLASVAFLDSLWEQEQNDDLGALLSGMQVCDSDAGPFTRDPAFLDDWNKRASMITPGPEAGYDALIGFLRDKTSWSPHTNFMGCLADLLESKRSEYFLKWQACRGPGK